MSDLQRETRQSGRIGRTTRFVVPGGGRYAHGLDALRLWLAATFEREMEAGRGFLWLPVLFGAGIVVYFALPAEPSGLALAAVSPCSPSRPGEAGNASRSSGFSPP